MDKVIDNRGSTYKTQDLIQVDQISKYITFIGLHLKNSEYENEWLLKEIEQKKNGYAFSTFLLPFLDIVYTYIISDASLIGKITRIILDVIVFLSFY